MKSIHFWLLLSVFHIQCATGQTDSYQELLVMTSLPSELKECSGLLDLGDGLYAGVNDSGNPAELIVFHTGSQSNGLVRHINIKGASNHDWEELASDDEYLYIGDTGNNSGTRKDICIYRVSRPDVLRLNEVFADKISFSFSEQKKFTPSNKHNFDCEAIVCVGDSLYLFTKNRGNSKTDLYAVPKIPGKYEARHMDRFDAGGLVTGAGYRSNGSLDQLALIGYTTEEKGYHPFIWRFSPVRGNQFFKAPSKQWLYSGSYQTESILWLDDQTVVVTNESEHGDPGFIFKAQLSDK